MKLFAVLLSLLGLSLLQEPPVAHACTCRRISAIVEDKVQKAVAGLEDKLDAIASKLEKEPTSSSFKNPSPSCKDLHEKDPSAPSGFYWIGDASKSVKMYCSMEETCGSETGGWMRVANIDMRNTSQNCPSKLTLVTSPKRLCAFQTYHQCGSNTFSVAGAQYSHVCGKIVSYQRKLPVAFFFHDNNAIDDAYVSGVSLTHGQKPRKHIWTFAGASNEESHSYAPFQCPCMNSESTAPSYVGNDYFCDTALRSGQNTEFITSDPLWDGQGCTTSSCCSFNTPPWFVRDLPSPTTDDIEMRLCYPYTNGDTPIEIVELYVQ